MLIGDAAHSVSPNLGYGATAGMADAHLLATTAASMHAGSAAGAQRTEHTFAGLAEEWTRERLHDAHAYTRLSRSVSDLTMFKIHKSWARLLAALPLAVPLMMGRMQFPGKGVYTPALLLDCFLADCRFGVGCPSSTFPVAGPHR